MPYLSRARLPLTYRFDLEFHHVVHRPIRPLSPVQVFLGDAAQVGLEDAKDVDVFVACERGLQRLIISIDICSDRRGSSMGHALRHGQVLVERNFLGYDLPLHTHRVSIAQSIVSKATARDHDNLRAG